MMATVSQASSFSKRDYEDTPNGPIPRASECALVGSCLLLSVEDVETLDQYVRPEDFYHEHLGKLFSVILMRAQKGVPVNDPFLLEVAMIEAGHRPPANKTWAEVYINCDPWVISPGAVAHHAQVVKESAIRREAIKECREVIKLVGEHMVSPEEISDILESRVEHIRRQRALERNAQAKDLAVDLYERTCRDADDQQGIVKSHIAGLDKITGGFHRGEYVILAARPSVGKSALATQIAAAEVARGVGVAIFSFEMDQHSVMKRIYSQARRFNAERVMRSRMNEVEMAAFKVWLETDVQQWPLWIYQDKDMRDPRRVRSIVKALQARASVGLVIIDYVQLMIWNQQRPLPIREALTMVSNEIKRMANDLDVPVLALSQLSRFTKAGKRNQEPTLEDLKETGALEQDADTVLLMHRTQTPMPETRFQGKVKLIVAKQRNGTLGATNLVFLGDTVTFVQEIKG